MNEHLTRGTTVCGLHGFRHDADQPCPICPDGVSEMTYMTVAELRANGWTARQRPAPQGWIASYWRDVAWTLIIGAAVYVLAILWMSL